MKLNAIGKNIRKYRIKRNLKQEELAEKVNISSTYVGMIERGEKIPSLYTFIDILTALDVSANMILFDAVDSKSKTSYLNERLANLSDAERNKILEVLEVLIRQAENN